MTHQEIWEQIKKMSHAEQLGLAEQIYALGSESELLKSRGSEAKNDSFPGRSAEDVLADLDREN